MQTTEENTRSHVLLDPKTYLDLYSCDKLNTQLNEYFNLSNANHHDNELEQNLKNNEAEDFYEDVICKNERGEDVYEEVPSHSISATVISKPKKSYTSRIVLCTIVSLLVTLVIGFAIATLILMQPKADGKIIDADI